MATKKSTLLLSALPPGELSKGAPVKQPSRHFAAGGMVDPYAEMNRLEVAQHTNDPDALNAAFDRDHAEPKSQGVTIPGFASKINQPGQSPLAGETTHQQDIDQRQSRITAYADKLKTMEANGRENSLTGFSSTITRGFANGGEPGAAIAAQGITVGRGGKIEGKGSPTSDSIPATVRETGEQIRVSTKERILSKAQDSFLEEIAQASGFESLNAMLQAGTGQPVGPAIKGGKRAAATGMEPEYTYDPALDAQVKQRAADSAEARRIVNETGPYNSSRLPSDAVPVALDANGRTAGGSMPGSLGASGFVEKPAAAGGLSPDRVAAAIAAPPTLGGAPLARSEPVGGGLTRAAQQVGQLNKEPATIQPASPVTPTLAYGATGITNPPAQAVAGTNESTLSSRQQEHIENNNLREFRDVGAGVTAQRGVDGRLAITNVGTSNITDPNNRGIDDSAAAAARHADDVKNGRTPQQVYERMVRNRMISDLTDPTITDPAVRANAAMALAHMDAQAGREAEGYGRLLDNQAKQAKLNSDGQIAGLQSQYLAETDPARREAIAERIRGVTGKSTAPTPANLQHIETERGTMVFDPRTGRMVPAVGPDGAPVGSGKALTEFQGKSTSFGMRADAASQVIDTVGQGGKVQPSLLKRTVEAVPLIGEGLGMAANRFASPEQQQVEQGQRDFINSVLRQESGAAISASEFDNARKQYFPQPNDSQEVIAQKRANREMAINGFRISAGPGARNIGGAPAQPQPRQPQQPAAAPKVGMVDGKHVFLGGNPADPASWAEVR